MLHNFDAQTKRARSAVTQATDALLKLFNLPLRVVNQVRLVIERDIQRRHLMSLDDRMLRDIGLTRVDVEREYSKPLWRP